MIAERNPDIRGAVNTLYRLSEYPEVRARMEQREKAKLDLATLLYAADTRGIDLGRTEIARNMKHMGLSLEAIEKATGLDPEAIKRL
jgi:predicted transposase YdaD